MYFSYILHTFCTDFSLISFSVLAWNLMIYKSVNIWYWAENAVNTESEKDDDEETENEEDEEEESGEESDTEDDQSDCDKDVDDSCPCPKSAKGEEKMVSFVENHIVQCSTYTRYMNYWIYILSVLLRMFLTQAACGLSVGVGSFSDPPEIPGLAHFLEHMVFMGSEKYTEVYLSWRDATIPVDFCLTSARVNRKMISIHSLKKEVDRTMHPLNVSWQHFISRYKRNTF